MTLSMVEEANTFSAGNNRACSDGRDRENEYSGGKGIRIGDRGSSKKGLLCYRSRLWEELLHMWRFQAYGPSLQK